MAKEFTYSNVTVFDTLAGSLGHGLQIIRAAELAEAGSTIEEIVTQLTDYRDQMTILILLDTLENIVKGGRLTKFQGSIAKLLHIKVLLEGVRGKVEVLEKVRGTKKFLNRVITVIGERQPDFSQITFGITHNGNEKGVEELKQVIMEQYHPKDVLINHMGATMGTYAGKDGMIISF